MLPKTLALVDDDVALADAIASGLRDRGIEVRCFRDSNDLLADDHVFAFDFYVVDVMLPGVDGIELIRILRRRSSALIVVMSGRVGPESFESAIEAGADMYLEKPLGTDHILLVARALMRRAGQRASEQSTWLLDQRAAQLVSPDRKRVALSENDLAVMRCFLDAEGAVVPRELLVERLGRNSARMADNTLHATIYRLRRRIELATGSLVPLQSEQRVGYIFRAPLKAT